MPLPFFYLANINSNGMISNRKKVKMTKIREQREFLKLSQTATAFACGVSLCTYQLWERGVGKPNDKNRAKVIEVLELPEDYFEA